jgi:hypothetical protein
MKDEAARAAPANVQRPTENCGKEPSVGNLPSGITSLSFPAPVPPLTLFQRQSRILCLGHSSRENIKAADVLMRSSQTTQLFIQLAWFFPRELLDASNAQQVEVAHGGWPDRNQVL